MLFRCLTLLTTITLFAGGSSLTAQEQLAWRFTPGESLKYVVNQKMDMTMDLAGNKQTVAMTQVMDMHWKISEVDARNGDVKMSQTVERLKMNSEGPPFGTVAFDSASETAPDTPLGKSLAEVFKVMIGKEFDVQMKSTGKIESVQVPASLIEGLKKAGSAGNAMDESTLKQMMTQSAITLPEKPIQPGEKWESVQQIEMPFGTMVVKSQLSFEGIDSSSGYALIAMKPTITVTPKEGAAINLTLNNAEGQGMVRFDIAKGRIARSDLDLTMDMRVKSFGQVIDQTVHQTTSMVLSP
ncbi:MAG TPA: DUF6263 family protein [Planctomycetaceae bacterium]|nr:DUF6263 family protein [Planctomycetaceae bacterium]HQZ69241.1 DUF6263 family protein [Planctomycetaceae bacterium]